MFLTHRSLIYIVIDTILNSFFLIDSSSELQQYNVYIVRITVGPTEHLNDCLLSAKE